MVATILFISYFILCHILVEKNKIPMWIQKLPMSKLIFIAIVMMGLSVIMSIGLGISSPSILVTIGFGSLLTIQYRRKIGRLEKGGV